VKKAYFDKAEAEMTSHFYEQAVKSYLEFIKKFPDHPRIDLITYFIGKMYFELEQYLKAIDYWEDLRSKFPLSDYRYVALERIGKTYMTMAQSDDYITFLKDGKHATGTVDEIRSSLELKGVETYLMIVDNKALEGSDEFFNAGKELATYYCRKEKLDKGLEVLNKLIGLYTAHPSVYTLLQLKAQIYYDLNVPDETVAAYEDLISLLTYKLSQGEEKNKNDYLIMIADAYFALGDLFYSQDRISESLYLYLEGVKKLPESEKRGWPLYQIANCYSNLDNYNKANYYYEKLKEEFPDNFWSEYVGWNKERLKWKEDMKEKGVRLKS
ncbi:MAG: tetratricopeptide repeat protein, partial [Candidatus Omnitrophota bacterium]